MTLHPRTLMNPLPLHQPDLLPKMYAITAPPSHVSKHKRNDKTRTKGHETEQNNNNKTLTLNLFPPNFHTTTQHITSTSTPFPCPCLHTMSCPVAVDNVCRQHNLQQPTVNEKGERLEVFFLTVFTQIQRHLTEFLLQHK